MTDVFELNAQIRNERGTSMARRLRRQEQVPAIVYGAGKEPQSITMSHKDLFYALQNEAVFSHILTLHIDNNKEKVVLKAVQRHPYKSKINHVDFLRIKTDEKITMNVPIHYVGEEQSPGVKEGGMLSKNVTELEISCLPGDLPAHFTADISTLELDHSLHISDIQLPKGVELTTELSSENDQTIITVHKPKAVVEEEPDVAEGETADKDEATPEQPAEE